MPSSKSLNYNNELYRTLSQIAYSNMEQDLKNDCICRVVSQAFGAGCVSMLHFDGAGKKLVCTGNYINHKIRATYKKQDFKNIIECGDILQYIKFLSENSKIQSLDLDVTAIEFTNNPLFNYGKPNKPDVVTNKRRLGRCFSPKSWDYNLRLYNDYRTFFSAHEVYLEEKVPTSNYYNLLLEGKYSSNIPFKKKVASIPFDEKKFLREIRAEFGFSWNNDVFVALPLIANTKLFGVIRILMSQACWNKIYKKQEDLLMSVATIISLTYGNQYSLESFKKLSLQDIQYPYKKRLDVLAEVLRKSINCYGCIIRLPRITKEGSTASGARIVGSTATLSDYVKNLRQSNPFKQGSAANDVMRLIFTQHGKNKNPEKIIACRINANNPAKCTYYYTFGDEIIKSTDDWKSIRYYEGVKAPDFSAVFTEPFMKLLQKEKVEEVVYIPVPKIEGGMVSFANTIFRSFSNNDIEFVIPTIRRLGLELGNKIKQLAVEHEYKKNETAKKYYDLTQSIHHDLRTPADEINSYLSVERKKIEAGGKKSNADLIAVQLLSEYLINLLEVFKCTSTVPQQGIIAVSPTQWSLKELLQKYKEMFENRWGGKRLIIRNGIDKREDLITGGKEIIGYAVFSLLENAVKFIKVGNNTVWLDAIQNTSNLVIKVTNVSELIPPGDCKRIGHEEGFRSIAEGSVIPGTGRGAYGVRLWMEFIGGEFEFNYEKGNAIAQIVLNNK